MWNIVISDKSYYYLYAPLWADGVHGFILEGKVCYIKKNIQMSPLEELTVKVIQKAF